MEKLLEVKDLKVDINGKNILRGLSFDICEGEFAVVAGPNGSGKSTLVRAIAADAVYEGSIRIKSDEASSLGKKELARRVGVLDQHCEAWLGYSVEDTVLMGRYARAKGLFSGSSDEDLKCAERAMCDTGVYDLRSRSVLTLSGGERQKVFLARVLCQDTDVLVLDEPTNNLDIASRMQIYETVKNWVLTGKRAAICVSHDLDLAMMYAKRTILMSEGKIVMDGESREVIMSENAGRVFSVDMRKYYDSLYERLK